jgi:hypothetical protein
VSTPATPLQVLALFMQMDANLGTPAQLVHRRLVDARGAPLRGTLVSGDRARVSIDGVTTPYITFEALVEDGWRFDFAGRDVAGDDLESDAEDGDDEQGEDGD